MLALAAVITLVVLGARDSLLLLCSVRPAIRTRLVFWAPLYLALAIPYCGRFHVTHLLPMLWAAGCAGHLMRWAVARWFDIRPSRNGLVWLSAVIPAPGFVLALSILDLPPISAIAGCALIAITTQALGCLSIEPVLDDIAHYSQSLDLAMASFASMACAASLDSSPFFSFVALCGSLMLLFCAALKARQSVTARRPVNSNFMAFIVSSHRWWTNTRI